MKGLSEGRKAATIAVKEDEMSHLMQRDKQQPWRGRLPDPDFPRETGSSSLLFL
jgi:hypothetical protein